MPVLPTSVRRRLRLAVRRGSAEGNLLPISPINLAEIQRLVAVSGGMAGDGDFVAGMQLMAVPAIVNEVVWRGHFDEPLLNIAVRILDVEKNQRMRLDKLEIRNRPGELRHRGIIVCRGPMMRK